jgi:DNA polymerase-4
MIRLIGIRLSKLVSGGMQLNLFDNSALTAPLYMAMDRIRLKYGIASLKPASIMAPGKTQHTPIYNFSISNR